MADCHYTDARMLDWLDSELGPPALRRVDEHLHDCAACRETGASLRWLRAITRQLPEEEPPAALSVRLMHEAARHALGASGAPVWSRMWTRIWSRFQAWLGRGLQVMAAHPAAAAVATLVLVAGAAGTMHLHGRDMAALHAPSSPPPPPAMESEVAAAVVAAAEEADEARPVADSMEWAGAKEDVPAKASAVKPRAMLADAKDEAARERQAPRREKKMRASSRPRAGSAGAGRGAALEESRADDSIGALLGGVATVAPGGGQTPSPAPMIAQPADRDGERRQDTVGHLHQALRQALRDGQCRTALDLARTMRQRDPAYHQGQVAPDADFQACQRVAAARAAKAAKSGEAAKEPVKGQEADAAARKQDAADRK